MRWLDRLECFLLIFGLLILGFYIGARIQGVVFSRAALQRFKSERSSSQQNMIRGTQVTKVPDFSLWSEKRIKDYQESLTAHFSPAVAVLRIPKINIEVPVLEGTDDLTLNRGVGLIAGTARPGKEGNVAIAGHRDGLFRGLKDVSPGDTIELTTQERTDTYVIDGIEIVPPSDVSVLAPRPRSSLTLVTCYPFYFVGSAPQRYIVQASIASTDRKDLRANKNPNSDLRKISEQWASK